VIEFHEGPGAAEAVAILGAASYSLTDIGTGEPVDDPLPSYFHALALPQEMS
jgi:hypothetical protein